jgi:hypothetical protein
MEPFRIGGLTLLRPFATQRCRFAARAIHPQAVAVENGQADCPFLSSPTGGKGKARAA